MPRPFTCPPIIGSALPSPIGVGGQRRKYKRRTIIEGFTPADHRRAPLLNLFGSLAARDRGQLAQQHRIAFAGATSAHLGPTRLRPTLSSASSSSPPCGSRPPTGCLSEPGSAAACRSRRFAAGAFKPLAPT